jgi:hypothetical protein
LSINAFHGEHGMPKTERTEGIFLLQTSLQGFSLYQVWILPHPSIVWCYNSLQVYSTSSLLSHVQYKLGDWFHDTNCKNVLEHASIKLLISCKYEMRFKNNNTPYMYFIPLVLIQFFLYTSYKRKKSNKNKHSLHQK